MVVKLCPSGSFKLSSSRISNARNSHSKKIVTVACADNSRVQRSPSSIAAVAAGLGALAYSSPALAAAEATSASSVIDGAMAGLAIGGVVVGAGVTAVFMQQASSGSSDSSSTPAVPTPATTPAAPAAVKVDDTEAQKKTAAPKTKK